MTPITNYFLTRLDSSGNTQVQVLDNTSYAAYQVYCDNSKVKESTSATFNAVLRKNKKVDVVGLANGEQGQDFSNSNTIGDDYGDKVEFILPIDFLNKAVKVYSDNQTGIINYGRPLAVGIADQIVGVDLGWQTFTADQWNLFTPDQWNAFDADGQPNVKLTITKRLRIGDWKFALVDFNPSDNFRDPFIFTKTIQTRPDEITPTIEEYDSGTDELLIGADGRVEGTYNLYAAPWGQSKTAINFSTPILASTQLPVVGINLRGSQTDNTRWFALRKTVGGVEEQNFNVLPFILTGAEWSGNYPSAPTFLAGDASHGQVRLRWKHQTNRDVDGFHIYGGTSSVSYTTPILTVPYSGGGTFSAILPAITVTHRYAVRAYRGSYEENNTNVLVVAAVSDPSWTLAAPTRFTAQIQELNTVRLKWHYQVNSAVPDGFHIYAGEGSVDYSTPIDDVPYIGNGVMAVTLPAISATTIYAVRAYTPAAEETNTNEETVSPLDDLVQITAEGESTWSEE